MNATGYHHLPAETVLALLEAKRTGLEEMEADRRLAEYGPNRLPEPKSKTVFSIFLGQFRSPFIYLLLIAAAVSIWLQHVMDAGFIFIVLLLNAAIGTYQEWRAETRARALQKLVQGSATVWRGMALVRIPVERLVPGDIVQLESGDKIPADIRLTEARGLMADESLLTGESFAVQKSADAALPSDAALGDRATMLHAGTTVQRGRAAGVVVTTGSQTSVGQLAAVLETKESAPPLVRRMAIFTRQVAVGMIGIIAVIAVIEVLRGASASEIFLLAVALAVSAIPEGLPVAMTVALSIAMHRMGLRNVVVRRLTAVEGLGSCSLIATDKTGTLTLNQLTIEKLWLPGSEVSSPEQPEAAPLLLAASHASEPPPAVGGKLVGDAVDLAFFASARAHGWKMEAGADLLLERIPYEPEKRFAAAFHKDGSQITAYVKGAPETILSLCGNVEDSALAAFQRLSSDGYRVIAVAAGSVAAAAEDALTNLSFLGFAALIDPLRPEAQSAVKAAQSAGLRVVMVTGDHPLTALAIARQLDLAHERKDVIAGTELAELEGEEFDRAVGGARVFARTEPLQKLAIVDSLRRQGHVVAVTGDGINDAAALHAADIGVAMGKGGTDVAREAADLILTDDNFASIVAGIEEGRVAHDNLRKVILLTISTGASEILLVLLAALSGFPPPLTAVQLLWLNLITNGIQDVALAFEKGEPGVLQRRPRQEARIFDQAMIEQVVISGLAIGLTAFIFYQGAVSAGMEHSAAQGAVLWLLVWCENAHCFNCRSETRSAFQIPLKHNVLLIAAVVGTQVIQIAVLSIPALSSLLSLQALTIRDGLALAGGGLVVLAVMESYKFLRRMTGGRA